MSPECPACQRRLSLRAGNEGTFKSSCPWDACGAELLCIVAEGAGEGGAFAVKGPTAMREEERTREITARSEDSRAAGWIASKAVLVGAGLGLLAFYSGLVIFKRDEPSWAAFFECVLFVAFFAVGGGGGYFLVARRRAPREPALRAVEGALEALTDPTGYRG